MAMSEELQVDNELCENGPPGNKAPVGECFKTQNRLRYFKGGISGAPPPCSLELNVCLSFVHV